MKIFGLTIGRSAKTSTEKALVPVSSNTSRGWNWIREPFAGAWQQNQEIRQETVLTFSAIYACVTLIAQDIGKMRVKLVELQETGIWKEVTAAAFSPVLRKQNAYQTRVKFFEYWITSKLIHGNTYILKERDKRGVVVAFYILDPTRVTPLVSDDGSVYYQLKTDNLSAIEKEIVVPAREIIHDRMICLFHPLIGVSPIYACGLAATQGIRIQENSSKFFGNNSNPGGILTAPGAIADETAQRLKTHWETNYTGNNIGKIAVLGDGLKYEAMAVNAVDAQLIEQLKWTAEMVCSAFHVPPYMIGVGPMPTYNNIEALNQQYYQQCLQSIIESAEICLDEGLELPVQYGTEFDLDALLRMDTMTRYKSHSDGISGGWLSPNEARFKEDRAPMEGGNTPYMQQQNYSLAALAKRDAGDPFPKPQAAALPSPDDEDDPDPEDDDAPNNDEDAAETDKQLSVFLGVFKNGLALDMLAADIVENMAGRDVIAYRTDNHA